MMFWNSNGDADHFHWYVTVAPVGVIAPAQDTAAVVVPRSPQSRRLALAQPDPWERWLQSVIPEPVTDTWMYLP